MKWMQKDRFYEFRQGWRTVLKGIMFRLVLIGFTQMSLLCLWELTKHDSVGAVVNAVIMFLTISALLFYASYRVIRLARRSISLHQSAAYILYSDSQQLNRWGFLYVQFRADAYYFILPLLIYALLKGALIAFMQPISKAMVHNSLNFHANIRSLLCFSLKSLSSASSVGSVHT
jgi:Transient receptor potential (TRP) ion channel